MGRQQLISLGSTIKTAYEGENDTNAFTDDDRAYVTDLIDNVTVDDDGNIGIGTTGPVAPLHVVGGNQYIGAYVETQSTAGYGLLAFRSGTSSGNYKSRIGATGDGLCMWAGDAECMRITSAGNVGIGTTNPQTKLHVDGTVRFDNLPTSDPASAGALWNDSGTLKISAG